MNTIEALAVVIAEQRQHVHQLEVDLDTVSHRAKRFETQFNTAEETCKTLRESLRLCKAEISDLKRLLSEYDNGYQ